MTIRSRNWRSTTPPKTASPTSNSSNTDTDLMASCRQGAMIDSRDKPASTTNG
ncbi:hypothetical protein D3C71_2151750 [compost metagenome]